MVTDGSTDDLADGGDDRTIVNELPVLPDVAEVRAGPRVVLLGSGELNRELEIALRRFGAEVITGDGHPGVSITAAGELIALVLQLQPDFVVPGADAVSLAALDALNAIEAGSDGAPEGVAMELVPSARSLRLTADREGLRRLAADKLGLPTAPFWFVGSLRELEAVAAHAGYPLLVKPVTGTASPASLANGPDDIERAWQRAVGPETAGTTRVLAETKVEIEFHITLIVVRSEGRHGPVIEFCAPIGHGDPGAAEQESWQPQQLTTPALDAAKSIAARIVKALGGRGAFSVELMINGDEVYFADVTPCPQETAWVTLRTQRLSAFELQARAILGLAVDTMMVSPGASRVIDADPDDVFDALTDALGVPESDVQVFGPRRGVALATAPDVGTARDRARQVANVLAGRHQR
ncbi:MAG: formate-dependent phosphoribosylglycinamide formyltransferase [Mycobacterium sp.]